MPLYYTKKLGKGQMFRERSHIIVVVPTTVVGSKVAAVTMIVRVDPISVLVAAGTGNLEEQND